MTFAINPDTDREEIADQIGASVDRHEVRTSTARERRLQKNIQRQARDWDTRVTIDEAHPTAHVLSEPGESPEVVISGGMPGQEHSWQKQPVTDYDGQAWDWMAQRAFGVHEVGHIRYTDFRNWDDHMSDFDRGDKGIAHSLHNALEDGAIEKQVANRWPNYYEVLRTLRANVFEATEPGIPDPEQGGNVFPVANAIHSAILDLWAREVYDLNIGVLDKLLDRQDNEYHFATEDDRDLFEDRAMPLIEDIVPTVLTTPNAEDRNAHIANFAHDIIGLLDDADADGKSQENGRKGDGEDASGMPDDSRDNHSGDADADAQELQPGAGQTEGDDDESGQAVADADPDDLDDIDEIQTVADVDQDAQESAQQDAREVAGVSEDLLDEMEEMTQALGASDELRSQQIQIPTEDWKADERVFNAARTQSGRLAQILRNRLQSERRTKVQRDTRRGRLDSSRFHRTATEDMPRDIKKEKNQPDEKDYRCALVLDRSVSMSGDMTAAEEAAGMMLMALEEVGVDTMLIEMHGSQARLAKPFGVSTESQKDRVFHGRTAGGTPLDQVLDITRERLHRESGKRFMVVLTDDELSGSVRENFEAGLRAANFPVLGVNLKYGGGSSDSADVYHREVTADPESNLQEALTGLVQEVMF